MNNFLIFAGSNKKISYDNVRDCMAQKTHLHTLSFSTARHRAIRPAALDKTLIR
jgi:hypothetical protein